MSDNILSFKIWKPYSSKMYGPSILVYTTWYRQFTCTYSTDHIHVPLVQTICVYLWSKPYTCAYGPDHIHVPIVQTIYIYLPMVQTINMFLWSRPYTCTYGPNTHMVWNCNIFLLIAVWWHTHFTIAQKHC